MQRPAICVRNSPIPVGLTYLAKEMFAVNLIYELTLSERDFKSDGTACSEKFMKAIHVVSSMARSQKGEMEILSYIKDFYVLDLKDSGRFELLKQRLNI